MNKDNKIYNLPGHPLRLHDLNLEALARMLYEEDVRFTSGRRVGEVVDSEGNSQFVGLHEGQRKVVESSARFKVLAAGRRYGKTATCTLLALAALLQPNRKVWIVGPEYVHVEKVFNELYSILVHQLKWIKKNAPDGTIARKNKGDYVLQLQNGSRIEGKSASNYDSMAGEALDLIIFDEAALDGSLEHVWDQMLRPTLADNKGSAIFISSPRGKNDFYKLYKLGELGKRQSTGLAKISIDENGHSNDCRDWESWRSPTYTNPFIDRQEYEDAKKSALLKGTYLTFRQEWDADFDAVSDAAFPEFQAFKSKTENGNITETPYHVQTYRFDPSFGPWFAACDFNIARPASTIYAQLDKDGNIMIFDEMFKPNTTTYMQAEYILEKSKELGVPYSAVIGDISGSFKRADGMNSFDQIEAVLGHQPEGTKQGRETGNNLIHEWLAYPVINKQGQLVFDENRNPVTYPKLFVASHCIETIHVLETAKRKLGKDGSIKEDYAEFKSGHEGLADGLRYLLVYLFHQKTGINVTNGVY